MNTRFFLGKTVFSKLRDVASAWKSICESSTQKPVYGDRILEQLVDTRVKDKELVFFSPWGPRYFKKSSRITEGDKEEKILVEIRDIVDRLNSLGYKSRVLIMPADAYGITINGLDEQFVRDYFCSLEERAREIIGSTRTDVEPWSRIKERKNTMYQELVDEMQNNLSAWIDEGTFRKAVAVASRFNPNKIEERARAYCIERLVEGMIIAEEDYIKLSLVLKEKDILDGPLKRIYVIKEKKPWMEGD